MNEVITRLETERQRWGRGPWDDEPDRIYWVDETTGFPCLILRNDRMGNWCGYVAVPPGHPSHGKRYDDVDVDVHGGLTYASECYGDPESGVCHVPAPGQPDDVWWFGFDCAHAFDLVPSMHGPEYVQMMEGAGIKRRAADDLWVDVYRDVAYVRDEVRSLAKQLA